MLGRPFGIDNPCGCVDSNRAEVITNAGPTADTSSFALGEPWWDDESPVPWHMYLANQWLTGCH